jgi:hypothetical protein
MVGLASNKTYANAYGIYDGAPYGGVHLFCVKQDEGVETSIARTFTEVTFDEGDIPGTFHVTGHPGVIGLWLASSSSEPIEAGDIGAPTDYVVPDFAPAANGLYVRGLVWPPGKLGRIAYP